jgi:hypothetical protein
LRERCRRIRLGARGRLLRVFVDRLHEIGTPRELLFGRIDVVDSHSKHAHGLRTESGNYALASDYRDETRSTINRQARLVQKKLLCRPYAFLTPFNDVRLTGRRPQAKQHVLRREL